MTRYVLGRILQMFPVLLGVVLAVFMLTHILPGDPVLLMLDVQYTEEEYKEMQTYLGLDKPLHLQFLRYLNDLIHGDLGRSIHSEEPVIDMILRRFPATFFLATSAIFLAAMVSIPIGVASALKQNTKIDYISMVGAQMGISMPPFWLGLMLILFLSLYLNILPPGGRGDPPDLIHLILPACTLSTPFMATSARLTRSCMLEVLGYPETRP